MPSSTEIWRDTHLPLRDVLLKLQELHTRADHELAERLKQIHIENVEDIEQWRTYYSLANSYFNAKSYDLVIYCCTKALDSLAASQIDQEQLLKKNRYLILLCAKSRIANGNQLSCTEFSIHFSQPDEALEDLKPLLELDGIIDSEACLLASQALLLLQDTEEAERSLHKVIENADASKSIRERATKRLAALQSLSAPLEDAQSPSERLPQRRMEKLAGLDWLHPSLSVQSVNGKGNGIVASRDIPAGSHLYLSTDAYVMFEDRSGAAEDSDAEAPAKVTVDFLAKFLYGLAHTIKSNSFKRTHCMQLDSTSHWIEEDAHHQSHRSFITNLDPSLEQLYVQLYRIVRTNAHGVTGGGSALFPLGSLLNHSCVPSVANPVMSFSTPHPGGEAWPTIGSSKGGCVRMLGTALIDIRKNQEITIQYVALQAHWSVRERRQLLAESYLFHCCCPMCRLQLSLVSDPTTQRMMDHLESTDKKARLVREQCKATFGFPANSETQLHWNQLDDILLDQLQTLSIDLLDRDVPSLFQACAQLSKTSEDQGSNSERYHPLLQQYMSRLQNFAGNSKVKVNLVSALVSPNMTLFAQQCHLNMLEANRTSKMIRFNDALLGYLRWNMLIFLVSWTPVKLKHDATDGCPEAIGANVSILAACSTAISDCIGELLRSTNRPTWLHEAHGSDWEATVDYYHGILSG